jgi:hypothetical protein
VTAFPGQLAMFKDDVVERCAEKMWNAMAATLKHLEPWDALTIQARRVWAGNIERIIENKDPGKVIDPPKMIFERGVLLETQKLLAALFIALQAEQGVSSDESPRAIPNRQNNAPDESDLKWASELVLRAKIRYIDSQCPNNGFEESGGRSGN